MIDEIKYFRIISRKIIHVIFRRLAIGNRTSQEQCIVKTAYVFISSIKNDILFMKEFVCLKLTCLSLEWWYWNFLILGHICAFPKSKIIYTLFNISRLIVPAFHCFSLQRAVILSKNRWFMLLYVVIDPYIIIKYITSAVLPRINW